MCFARTPLNLFHGRWLVSIMSLAATVLSALGPAASADPCGMVQRSTKKSDEAPITRIGAQITYVFFQHGTESLVIRPGFSGKVEEFGMLVPLPGVPALRKVPDDIFAHVASAVDPPEIVVHAGRFGGMGGGGLGGGGGGLGGGGGFAVEKDEVKVLKEEGIGMYEVVVLAAGSADALERWMNEHRYRYPTGMDKACEDYVQQGWCFVAVRARVAAKSAVDPKPGMRKIDAGLPPGAAFDGYVQAMGFRFHSKSLVVPMRLSAFNDGKLHNIVFLLTGKPMRIRGIDTKSIKRQVPGDVLYENVTSPLPLRVIGRIARMPLSQRRSVAQQRDPTPNNGLARQLCAADLLAVQEGRLDHFFEEREKELLEINEQLGLRGPEIGKLTYDAVNTEREQGVRRGLGRLKAMTMTVIDGDFPRDVLAKENLTFAKYRMDPRLNSPWHYNSRLGGPAAKPEGRLIGSDFNDDADSVAILGPQHTDEFRRATLHPAAWAILGLALCGIAAHTLVVQRRRGSSGATMRILSAAALSGGLITLASAAFADEETTADLIEQLRDSSTAPAALDKLTSRGERVAAELAVEARAGTTILARGWSIVGLRRIGGPQAKRHLRDMSEDATESRLVRVWAAAARVQMTQSVTELDSMVSLISDLPPIARIFAFRWQQLDSDAAHKVVGKLIQISMQSNNTSKAMRSTIDSFGSIAITKAMLTDPIGSARWTAAGYLATRAIKDGPAKQVSAAVIEALKFDPAATRLPWNGGPLFLPSVNWNKEFKKRLVRDLIAWYVWCNESGAEEGKTQIDNSLRNLYGDIGRTFAGEPATTTRLRELARIVGGKTVEELIDEQHLRKKYQALLDSLR